MSALLEGLLDWGREDDTDGHRTYTALWGVRVTHPDDGPNIAMSVGGIPAVGSTWNIGNDSDPNAYCWPNWSVETRTNKEPNLYWTLRQTFSTKPIRRCMDNSIENPIAEPPRISGSFSKRSIQGTKNRAGALIMSSSHELITGKQMEFENNRPTVRIEMNFPNLQLSTFAPMVDRLNDREMWGVAPRCIKLSNASWSRQVYGVCGYYYTVVYEFDVNYDTFDRWVPDEGTSVLMGWSPGHDSYGYAVKLDPDAIDATTGLTIKENPIWFEIFKTKNGEAKRTLLDGKGRPLAAGLPPVHIKVEFYEEANLYLLGIPADLG